MRTRRRLVRPAVLLAAIGALLGAIGGGTFAAFSAVTANPASSFEAKPVFPGVRSTSAWDLRDGSSGAEGDQSNLVAFADARVQTTSSFDTAFATTRYIDFDLNSSLAPGLPVSNVSFNFRHLPVTALNTACFYFEVRRASSGVVLATHGSSGTPVACKTGSTYTTTSTALPSVTSSDIANDLRIRVFAAINLPGSPEGITIDTATVTGSLDYAGFTLYEKRFDDTADTTPAVTPWSLAAAADGSHYQSANSWPTAFDAAKYVKLTLPGYVPNAAVITSVTLEHAYRSTTPGDNTCWYLEVYSRTTLIATHGSAGTPVSCNSTASFVTDTVTLSAVDTVGEANNLVLKMFVRNSGAGTSQHDLVRLNVDYSLNPGTCASFGSQTLSADRDSYVKEDVAPSNFGTELSLWAKSATGANNRALVHFALPALPGGCTLQEATLRLYTKTAALGRTIEAYRAAAAWTETGVTWANQPATAGTPASSPSASAWRDWNVLSQVQAMYAGANDGFVLRDSAESAATPAAQELASREDTVGDPELYVAWG